MSEHFLLSRLARDLPVTKVIRMSEDAAYNWFRRARWPETKGKPYCPHCGVLECYVLTRGPAVGQGRVQSDQADRLIRLAGTGSGAPFYTPLGPLAGRSRWPPICTSRNPSRSTLPHWSEVECALGHADPRENIEVSDAEAIAGPGRESSTAVREPDYRGLGRNG